MQKKTAQMVSEDDPHWQRFWAVFPLKVAKKEARVAWMQAGPTPELVDRMIATLAWQAPFWAAQGYGTPYPASWIRGERWSDERPQALSPPKGEPAAAWMERVGYCFHVPACMDSAVCRAKRAAEKQTS